METGTTLLLDMGVIIVASTFLGFIARALRQPLVLAYVLAGIIIGPSILQIITEEEVIDVLAEFGIALLLFMVGLELDLKRLKDVGKVSIGCGLGQIVITFFFGYLLAQLLGFEGYASFYVAFGLTISSTMVVVKLLSDRNELDTLHGKIVLGTLLVQDIVTIMVLAALPNIGSFSLSIVAVSIVTGLGLVSIAMICSRFILPFFTRFAAKSVELLFLFSLSWCFIFASFTYLVFLNLLVYNTPQFAVNSIPVGAFLAGVSLASFPYNLEIVGRIRPLKDFFLTLFFASLGMRISLGATPLDFSTVASFLSSFADLVYATLNDPLTLEVVILSVYVLLGTTAIMLVITTLFGYGKRTAFMTAISLAQISEFSLILAIEGQALGHIDDRIFSLITGVVLITITVSSYFIMYGNSLYSRMRSFLRILDRFSRSKELEDMPPASKQHVIVCGCHRMGSRIVEVLKDLREDFLVVDYNPEIVKQLIEQRIPCIYGDIGDPDILERIDLKDARIVLSTIPDPDANSLLIFETKKRNPKTFVFITAENLDEALELYNEGADYVMLPRMICGEKAGKLLKTLVKDVSKMKKVKAAHIFKLEDMKKEELLWKYEPSFLKSLERKLGKHRHGRIF